MHEVVKLARSTASFVITVCIAMLSFNESRTCSLNNKKIPFENAYNASVQIQRQKFSYIFHRFEHPNQIPS